MLQESETSEASCSHPIYHHPLLVWKKFHLRKQLQERESTFVFKHRIITTHQSLKAFILQAWMKTEGNKYEM